MNVEPGDDGAERQAEAIVSLVLRIWQEAPGGRGGSLWRGHITHVQSGRRRYVRSLAEIGFVVAAYLPLVGAHAPLLWRIWRALRCR